MADNILKELKQSHNIEASHRKALTVAEQELFIGYLIHGGVKVGVTKDLLNDLDIDVVLKQAGCESVTQGVAGEPGQQYRIFEFCQLLVIAIPDENL